MTTVVYKLTDKDGKTYGSTQWGRGVSHSAPGTGELCTGGWIHAYTSPLLAVLLNPIHAGFQTPRLWVAAGEPEKEDHGLKVGVRKLTTRREIPLPAISLEQRITFALSCALAVYPDPRFATWARAWQAGTDRTVAAARAAEAGAEEEEAGAAEAARAAAWAAAAEAAAEAARAAAWAAAEEEEAAAVWVARAAAEAAAEAAAWAARAAAWAAAEAVAQIDLHALAQRAMATDRQGAA